MARITIEVELGWLHEDGNIDELVKEEVVSGIVSRISSNIQEQIVKTAQERISEKVSSQLDEQVNKITEQLLNKRFTLTDKWGDVVEAETSVIDQLKKRLDNFMEEKVDKEGRTGTYQANKTRLDYLIEKNIDYRFKSAIDSAVKAIKAGLEKHIETTIKDQIGNEVAQLIGLEKIFKGL